MSKEWKVRKVLNHYKLVVYGDVGEQRTADPIHKLVEDTRYVLYALENPEDECFLWRSISGDIQIPVGIALAPGWRYASNEDSILMADDFGYLPPHVEVYMNPKA